MKVRPEAKQQQKKKSQLKQKNRIEFDSSRFFANFGKKYQG